MTQRTHDSTNLHLFAIIPYLCCHPGPHNCSAMHNRTLTTAVVLHTAYYSCILLMPTNVYTVTARHKAASACVRPVAEMQCADQCIHALLTLVHVGNGLVMLSGESPENYVFTGKRCFLML